MRPFETSKVEVRTKCQNPKTFDHLGRLSRTGSDGPQTRRRFRAMFADLATTMLQFDTKSPRAQVHIFYTENSLNGFGYFFFILQSKSYFKFVDTFGFLAHQFTKDENK